MSKTEKETKKNLDELKERKIDEEMLEDVAGGVLPGETDFFGIKDATTHPNAKKDIETDSVAGGMSLTKMTGSSQSEVLRSAIERWLNE